MHKGTLDDRGSDGGTNFILRIKEQETRLTLQEHDDDECTNSCFIISLLYASRYFEHCVLIIRSSKLYYTASGIITPVGDRPVHRLRVDSLNRVHRTATYRCDDTRCCIIQF